MKFNKSCINSSRFYKSLLVLFLINSYLFSSAEIERNQKKKVDTTKITNKSTSKRTKIENLDRLLQGIPAFNLKQTELESPTSIFPTLMLNIFNDERKLVDLPLASDKTTKVPSFNYYAPESKIEKTFKSIYSTDTSGSKLSFDIKFTDSFFKELTFNSKNSYKLTATKDSKLTKLLIGFYQFNVNKQATAEAPLFNKEFKEGLLDFITKAIVFMKDPQKVEYSIERVKEIPLETYKEFFNKFGTHFISRLEIGCLTVENLENSDFEQKLNITSGGNILGTVGYDNERTINRKNQNNFYVGTIEKEQCQSPEPIGFEFNPIYDIIEKIDDEFIKRLPFFRGNINESKYKLKIELTEMENDFLKRELNNKKVNIKNVITDVIMLDSGNPNNNPQIKGCLENATEMKASQFQINKLEAGKWYPIFYRNYEVYPDANLRSGKITGWNPLKSSDERFYDLYICIFVDKLVNANRVVKDIDVFSNRDASCKNPEKDPQKKSEYHYQALSNFYETVYYSICVGYYSFEVNKEKGYFWEMSKKISSEGYIKSLAAAYDSCPKALDDNGSFNIANQAYTCMCDPNQDYWFKSLNFWSRTAGIFGAIVRSQPNGGIYLCYSKDYKLKKKLKKLR